MPHYNAYDSFKTKKSKEKKQRAKDKSMGKKQEYSNSFIVENSNDFGIVIDVKYNEASVLYNDEIISVSLRKDINEPLNKIIFPGDKVIIDASNVIQNLLKRSSMLSRIKKDRTRIDDLGITLNIAANINLAVIVVSAKEPPLHPKFIDRYLMILQNNNIDALICLNKCDLKTEEEDHILDIYRSLGISVVETSTYTNIGIEELGSFLIGKQSIFVGNSGVGKSSLTNALMEKNEIATKTVGEKSKRGRHTTTTSKYYVWNENSSIIDTPGIRSLDVSTFKPEEIENYFPEFENWSYKCKYKDCLHFNEPDDSCMVKKGVEVGTININRYESYCRILQSIGVEKNT